MIIRVSLPPRISSPQAKSRTEKCGQYTIFGQKMRYSEHFCGWQNASDERFTQWDIKAHCYDWLVTAFSIIWPSWEILVELVKFLVRTAIV